MNDDYIRYVIFELSENRKEYDYLDDGFNTYEDLKEEYKEILEKHPKAKLHINIHDIENYITFRRQKGIVTNNIAQHLLDRSEDYKDCFKQACIYSNPTIPHYVDFEFMDGSVLRFNEDSIEVTCENNAYSKTVKLYEKIEDYNLVTFKDNAEYIKKEWHTIVKELLSSYGWNDKAIKDFLEYSLDFISIKITSKEALSDFKSCLGTYSDRWAVGRVYRTHRLFVKLIEE